MSRWPIHYAAHRSMSRAVSIVLRCSRTGYVCWHEIAPPSPPTQARGGIALADVAWIEPDDVKPFHEFQWKTRHDADAANAVTELRDRVFLVLTVVRDS